ncbi:hypothetical protein F0U60_42295 [Archangium minus]|uniref:Uncharacterized protein n=1 Tax=Archangium minus TaxID=83450 RepID=A0ABY9X3R5_9BACT|nr:hypothetical protein F0U60_42295 [Archangium minus]
MNAVREELLWNSEVGDWSSSELFARVRPEDIIMPEQDKRDYEPILWNDLCSEFDAQYMNTWIRRSGLTLSGEFHSFVEAWSRDEYNHYLGFRRIYSLFYGESEAAITERLEARKPDFRVIDDFGRDEFLLCAVLAYDEIATTRSYIDDTEFYGSLGPSAFRDWVRWLVADEARHFMNLLRVMQGRHAHRLAELPAVLDRILEIDLTKDSYEATFVLDHHGPQFSEKMLKGCVETILSSVQKVPRVFHQPEPVRLGIRAR